MDPKIIIEISGRCNARCPWCFTGRHNRAGQPRPGRFLPPEEFGRILARLGQFGLLGPESLLELFNWGEPLLHPELGAILAQLESRGLGYRLSTNASVLPRLEKTSLRHLRQLVISMPGFSQDSYDLAHGFEFPRILSNIQELLRMARAAGCVGQAGVSFHLYQHNLHEVPAAREFCRALGLHFFPYLATPNDFSTGLAYLQGTLDPATLARMGRELLLFAVDRLRAMQPPGYRCFQQDKMLVDEDGQVLTCCILPRTHPDYALGSVFDLRLEDIQRRKADRPACRDCLSSGLSFWFLHPVQPQVLNVLHAPPAP